MAAIPMGPRAAQDCISSIEVDTTRNSIRVESYDEPITATKPIQKDRFATYDEADFSWAIPLGYVTIGRDRVQLGDKVSGDELCEGLGGKFICTQMTVRCSERSRKWQYELRGTYQ